MASRCARRIAEHMKIASRAAAARLSTGCRSTPTNAPRARSPQGDVDLLCTPTNDTLERRKHVSFSLPIFAGGIRAVVRTDAPPTLRDALDGALRRRAVWRGSPARQPARVDQVRRGGRHVARKTWLSRAAKPSSSTRHRVALPDYASGISSLLDARSTCSSAIATWCSARASTTSARQNSLVLDRQFTHEPLALALRARRRRLPPAGRSRAEPHLQLAAISRRCTSKWFGDTRRADRGRSSLWRRLRTERH